MTDVEVQSMQDRVRSAVSAKTPLAIRGGGTRDFYGQAIVGDVVDMTPLAGIVDYDPTELVVTARAGTPVTEIDDALAARGQMLGCDAPRFGPGATFGGLVATGLSGPRRPYAGAVRDLILGVRIVDGNGDDLSFGGRVMKNVAGFDVARLMTGALGTLGIIIEISMKCLPLPKVEATRMLECTAEEAIRRTNEWGGKPLPISATCHYAGQLFVRISSSA
ncbi:MAG TPA: glycolate oxidase subunit GlcE, partial [Casimicrobiaceae bacterium]|nr:glycolate oxidase subunit GlcE [Casimicrobiaceae bacterium]